MSQRVNVGAQWRQEDAWDVVGPGQAEGLEAWAGAAGRWKVAGAHGMVIQ